MTAPIDLDDLKDDLGIADDYSDAWLTRRVEAIWSRIETYTQRTLRVPPATFRDTWTWPTLTVYRPPVWTLPIPPVFLRQFPVTEIVSYETGGVEGDLDLVQVEMATGKILTLDGNPLGWPPDGTAIAYKAGWDVLPAELYEIVLSIMTPLWTSRKAQTAGTLTGVTSINIADTGSIDLAGVSSTDFVGAALKGDIDPMLGPYTATLDPYVDWRSTLGSSNTASSVLVDEGS
jgi:hypothetical protein